MICSFEYIAIVAMNEKIKEHWLIEMKKKGERKVYDENSCATNIILHKTEPSIECTAHSWI